MGATLDFNIVSKKLIDIFFILQLLNDNFNIKVSVKKIEVMDDWEYNNQMELFNINELDNYINKHKILVLDLSNLNGWTMGMHIEKENHIIVYNIWFDTSFDFVLDSDSIRDSNQIYYDNFYKIVCALYVRYQSSIIISMIGVETMFQYDDNFDKMILETYNVNAWIMQEITKKDIDHYSKKYITDFNLVVFEKR